MQPTQRKYDRAVRFGKLLKYVSEHGVPSSPEDCLRVLSDVGYTRIRFPGESRFADIRLHSPTYGHLCVEGHLTHERLSHEDILRHASLMFHNVYEQARRSSFVGQERRILLDEMPRPLEERVRSEVLGDDGAPLSTEHGDVYRHARDN